jgi:four helix bundle protein
MTPEELKSRTKKFALRIIKMTQALPKNRVGDVLGKQVLRSATSIGANYRAACRARSEDDFISKIGIVEEETDETLYWLEMIGESAIINPRLLENLMKEADELTAIFTASRKTARINQSKNKINKLRKKL